MLDLETFKRFSIFSIRVVIEVGKVGFGCTSFWYISSIPDGLNEEPMMMIMAIN